MNKITDFARLQQWFEDQFDRDSGRFVDDLDPSDVQSSIYNFGVESAPDRSKASCQLIPVLNNNSNVADDIMDSVSNSTKFISQLEAKRDFDYYNKMIENRVQPALARQFGIDLAKDNIRSNADLENSANFLREYSPQTLGGFRTQEIRRTKAFRTLFGEE